MLFYNEFNPIRYYSKLICSLYSKKVYRVGNNVRCSRVVDWGAQGCQLTRWTMVKGIS